jgi:integrase
MMPQSGGVHPIGYLTEEQRKLLLEVIDPGSLKNPFEIRLRVRNRAIIMLPFTFGMRAGELLGIKRIDFDDRSFPATLTIHRRPNDNEDPRTEPARTKTRARMFNIEGRAKLCLEAWLKDRSDRGRFPMARKHGYIFTNENGAPISLRGARRIFERLRKCYPDLGEFCQHVLRHDVNDRLWEFGEETGADAAEIRADAIALMGWSEKSKRPEEYAKSAIRKKASDRILALQSKNHRGDKQ